MKGFEPLTSYTRSKRSTKLSYILKSYSFVHILFYIFFNQIQLTFNPIAPYRYKADSNGLSVRSEIHDRRVR